LNRPTVICLTKVLVAQKNNSTTADIHRTFTAYSLIIQE